MQQKEATHFARGGNLITFEKKKALLGKISYFLHFFVFVLCTYFYFLTEIIHWLNLYPCLFSWKIWDKISLICHLLIAKDMSPGNWLVVSIFGSAGSSVSVVLSSRLVGTSLEGLVSPPKVWPTPLNTCCLLSSKYTSRLSVTWQYKFIVKHNTLGRLLFSKYFQIFKIHFLLHYGKIKALQALHHAPPLYLNQASAITLSKKKSNGRCISLSLNKFDMNIWLRWLISMFKGP